MNHDDDGKDVTWTDPSQPDQVQKAGILNAIWVSGIVILISIFVVIASFAQHASPLVGFLLLAGGIVILIAGLRTRASQKKRQL